MAKLAPVIDSIDAVPEGVRDFYVPGEGASAGKFVLDTDVDAHPATGGLKAKNQQLLRDAKAATDRAKLFEGLDPEAARAALAAQQKAEEERLRTTGDAESRIKAVTEEHRKEREKLEAQLKERDAFIESSTCETAARDALLAEGDEGTAELLTPHVLRQVKPLKDDKTGKWRAIVVDKNGNTRYNTAGDEMSIKELVVEMRANDKYKGAFPAPAASGTGARVTERKAGVGDVKLTKEQGLDRPTYLRAKADADKRGVRVIIED